MSALAAGATALVACAPAAAPSQPAAQDATGGEQPAAAPQQVRYASFDWFAYVPGQTWNEFNVNEAFPRYKEEHGDVELLWEPHGDGWETKTLTNMAAGTAPDIMSVWPPIINTWAEKQQLLDLQPLVDADIPNADEIFLKSGWEQCWDPINQTRMGTVTDIDVTSVYYSKSAFEEAGVALPTVDWTTDQYTEAATRLTQRNGDQITRWGAQLRPDYALGYFYYVEAFGGKVRDPNDYMTCLLGEAPALEALEWIRQGMWDINCFAQTNQVNATGIPNTWTGVLPAGIVAFAERSADQFFSLADALPEGSWNIGHVAKGPVDQASMGAPDIWCVYKGVAERGNQDAVWDFLKWMSVSDYYQDSVARVAGRIPGLISAANKWPDTLRSLDARLGPVELEVVIDQLTSGEARAPQLFRYQSIADELINPAMDSIFLEGKAPVDIMVEVAQQVTDAQKAELARAGG
jgi:ABC-type glycerol-3-phosphate transport system substrate-binding protein